MHEPAAPERAERRENAFGALRLILASAVLVSHTPEFGFGAAPLGRGITHGQTDVGTMSVCGFFAVSGYLISASALRLSFRRYAWHRFLRIMPGLWAGLLVTAFVAAPLVSLRERGTLDGLWDGRESALGYVAKNSTGELVQPGIAGLLGHSPWAKATGMRQFNGSLWSIGPEIGCYVLVAILTAAGVFRRARIVVPALAGAGFLLIAFDHRLLHRPMPVTGTAADASLPPLASRDTRELAIVCTVFLVGVTAQLYRDRLVFRDRYGVLALAVIILTLGFGGWTTFGLIAYAYFLYWAASRLPARTRRVGRENDYSYGIYIYGALVQQMLSAYAGYRWGPLVYTALAASATVALAYVSWKVVERPALRWKDWQRRPTAGDQPKVGYPATSELTHKS